MAEPSRHFLYQSRLFHLIGVFTIASSLLTAGFAFADENILVSSEYKLKAAYLFNFLKFAEFDNKPLFHESDEILLAIVGENPFGTLLNSFSGRSVIKKKLVIEYKIPNDQVSGCHLVFVTGLNEKKEKQFLNKLEGSGILSVGETERFVRSGGIASLVLTDNELELVINLKAAKREGVVFSTQLLQIARTVRY